MHNSIATNFLLLSALFIITSCGNYSVSINENEVYSPSKLFTQFSLKDAELQRCVDAIIKEEMITNANQLTRIMCSAGEIQYLDGLNVFANVTQVGLKTNKISSLAPLAKLKKLQQIDVSENPIADLSALLALPELTYLNIEGITTINCKHVIALKETIPALKIAPPAHCKTL